MTTGLDIAEVVAVESRPVGRGWPALARARRLCVITGGGPATSSTDDEVRPVARTRILKPGFFKNEHLADLPFETRLCFAGLWTLADREGRLEDRPKRIKSELFPYDDMNIEASLDALADAGFVQRYTTNDGTPCLCIPNFLKHQRLHPREAPSTLDPPRSAQGMALDAPRRPASTSTSTSPDATLTGRFPEGGTPPLSGTQGQRRRRAPGGRAAGRAASAPVVGGLPDEGGPDTSPEGIAASMRVLEEVLAEPWPPPRTGDPDD
jgi:hypothetical protein